MKIASQELAYTNQILLTMLGQGPNQLFKGVSSAVMCGRPDARSGNDRGLACAYC